MIIQQDAERYAETYTSGETVLLRELREATTREMKYDNMLSGPVVGAFLNMLIRTGGFNRVLEVGTFTGYATLWMAMGLPAGGEVLTCETNDKYARVARRFFRRYHNEGGTSDIQILFGPAMDTIHETVYGDSPGRARIQDNPGNDEITDVHDTTKQQKRSEPLDFIFLDADKEHYPDYYELLIPALRPGGLMVVDNAFWGGKVWEIGRGPDPEAQTAAIHKLNRHIAADERVENVLLTVRDGLHLVRKKAVDSDQ